MKGAGDVYELTPSGDGSWSETVLHTFVGNPCCRSNDGVWPFTGVIFDSAGNLYGTTQYGGTSTMGTVFALTPDGRGGWTENVLHSFQGGADGALPGAGLVVDQSGNLYGTTIYGGTYNNGVIFKLTRTQSGWTESAVYNFTGEADGAQPGQIIDVAGNLFGVASAGNYNNCGVIFEWIPAP